MEKPVLGGEFTIGQIREFALDFLDQLAGRIRTRRSAGVRLIGVRNVAGVRGHRFA